MAQVRCRNRFVDELYVIWLETSLVADAVFSSSASRAQFSGSPETFSESFSF